VILSHREEPEVVPVGVQGEMSLSKPGDLERMLQQLPHNLLHRELNQAELPPDLQGDLVAEMQHHL